MFKVPAPDDEWLNAFLTVRPLTDGPLSWFSTFSAVVRDAREVTGRHLDTGEVENDARAGNWLGAVAYLIFLDQIGDCFEPDPILRPPAENTAAIVWALTYFEPSLSDDDILPHLRTAVRADPRQPRQHRQGQACRPTSPSVRACEQRVVATRQAPSRRLGRGTRK